MQWFRAPSMAFAAEYTCLHARHGAWRAGHHDGSPTPCLNGGARRATHQVSRRLGFESRLRHFFYFFALPTTWRVFCHGYFLLSERLRVYSGRRKAAASSLVAFLLAFHCYIFFFPHLELLGLFFQSFLSVCVPLWTRLVR